MISYAWVESIPSDQSDDLAALLDRAVDYDAEAGFSTANPDRPAVEGVGVHHLLVAMPPRGSRGSPELERLPDVDVVAYLRLDVLDGVGEAALVVRPEFRSLGVATLLMERLRDEQDGWAAISGLTRVAGWSHGSHPAAQRMSWRFGAAPGREVVRTLMVIGGSRPFRPEVAVDGVRRTDGATFGEPAPGHAAAACPADLAMRDRVATRLVIDGVGVVAVGSGVEGDPEAAALLELDPAAPHDKDDLVLLLSAGAVAAQDGGARLASLYVDATDEVVLHVSRELGFFHDQTDRRYDLTLG